MSFPVIIRRAGPSDLNFIFEVDLLSEGISAGPAEEPLAPQERREYRDWLSIFVSGPSDGAWIAEDTRAQQPVGMILARFRDRFHEEDNEANRFLFQYLDPTLFPADGRFCEIFNLWVHAAYRRKGLATRLKQEVESETRRRGIQMIYTHTLAANLHVLELNQKLGYRAVRTGPLWDPEPRVSLVKWLDENHSS